MSAGKVYYEYKTRVLEEGLITDGHKKAQE